MSDDIVTISHDDRTYRIINPGPGSRVGSKLARGEPYERQLLTDIRQHGFVGTAFDVGAHVGNHTLWLAAVCGLRVHAWEPFPASRKALRANLDLNPGLDVKVHAWAAGAADTRGRINGGMTIKLDRGKIPVKRIDDHLDVDDLAVMKVDVEGMEAEVLAGAVGHIERCRPVIYCEAHNRTASRKVAAVIEPLGYTSTRTIRMGSPMERWECSS